MVVVVLRGLWGSHGTSRSECAGEIRSVAFSQAWSSTLLTGEVDLGELAEHLCSRLIIGHSGTSLVQKVAQVVVDPILHNLGLVSATASVPSYAFVVGGGRLAPVGLSLTAVEHILLVGGQAEVRLPVIKRIPVTVVYTLAIGCFEDHTVQVGLLLVSVRGDIHPGSSIATNAPLEPGDPRPVFSIDQEQVISRCADHHAGVLGC